MRWVTVVVNGLPVPGSIPGYVVTIISTWPSHRARDTRVCAAWPAIVVLRDSLPSSV